MLSFFALVLLVEFCGQARADDDLSQQTRSLYQQALEQYGLAMGERGEKSQVSKLILGQVAEVICLVGDDVQACLDASKEAGRVLGKYVGALEPGVSMQDGSDKALMEFLKELHDNSRAWGLDASVASEALGHVARIQADALRESLAARWRPKLQKLLSHPSSVKTCLRAVDLARRILDQDSQVKAGMALSAVVDSGQGGSFDDATRKSIGHALKNTRDTMMILGLTKDPRFSHLARQCEEFDTKSLAAPDLDFSLTRPAEEFHADLPAAQKRLVFLADKAGLRSRVSVLFTYLASYAGVILQQEGAARALDQIMDVLTLTDGWLAARALGLRGLDAMDQGDFWSAVRLLKRSAGALKSFANAGALRGMALANAAQALFYLGQYDRAAAEYTKASDLFSDFPELRAKTLVGLVHCRVFAGKLDVVPGLLHEATALVDGLKGTRKSILEQKLELNRALYLLASGKKQDAVKILEHVAGNSSRRQKGSDDAASIALTNLAEIMNDSGEHSKALSYSEKALAMLDPASQADAYWQALCEKGRALFGLGRSKSAAKAFGKSMDMVEVLRSKVGAEGARRSFSAAKKRLYSQAIWSLASSGQQPEAFFVSERARGRAFLDMLGERQIHLGNKAINSKLQSARAKMLAALPPMVSDFQDPAASSLEKKLSFTRHHETSRERDPAKGWLSLVTVNPAGVRDVQKVLRPHEGLVSFFHDGKRLEIFLVTSSAFHSASVDVSETMLTRRTEDLLRKLRRPDDGEAKVRKKAGRLWDLTLGPISRHLTSLHSLVIVPWGPLHYVPFQTLYDGKLYAVDRWEMVVSPSASALVMIRSEHNYHKKLRRPDVFALGNPVTDLEPLPAAAQEAMELGKLFTNAKVRTGPRATKESVEGEGVDSSIIHLASHGVFLPARPMDSYLALSGKTPHGEHLSAMDILGLDLSRSRLVVLSACSSGKVKVAGGEEIVGFTRAFLHAGTPSLVASLWPISDSASMQFVKAFYGAIKKGLSPRAALARAQRAMKSSHRFSHPFYWAPFELVGS